MRRDIEGLFGSRIANGVQLMKCLAQAMSRRSAPPQASPTLVDDEVDFGTVVDVTTGQARQLSQEESERAATSFTARNAETRSAKSEE
jgi:hypothetical protein